MRVITGLSIPTNLNLNILLNVFRYAGSNPVPDTRVRVAQLVEAARDNLVDEINGLKVKVLL